MPKISDIIQKDIKKDFKNIYIKLEKETKKMIKQEYQANNENELFTSVIKKENTLDYITYRVNKIENKIQDHENRLKAHENRLKALENKR